ncbi:MAG: type II toxin-antitoxin system Phd/YefM family antitoxin [Holophagales bacterium]|nr:type II toxin-antitoxin system Phd/YefM family antitoxin [Holophagales bacterium]MXX61736.1 type II toxin-antitoxin system Phd/YefM family antitoxin [Holophagales bacterium]MYC09618.1 type II toxin-antitoxin system Phd/YefM family antitoxin [Holophagales bacterium]MYD22603.1 type II toxin-antitoxin system Phd/YefM family antitoxin [Holophagales bacterium]MYI31473.1 type II toxin-antitoxin system Phd/YefM family antitoxin [Holophagales bacterium]
MRVSISEAKGKLSELVRRAEAGHDVVLTRHGRPTVALIPVRPRRDPEARRAVIASVRRAAAGKGAAGASAARSQDFLYGDSGLPE